MTRTSILLVGSMFVAACVDKSALPPSITPNAIRSIRLGMARSEVEAVLGPPTNVGPPVYPGADVLEYGSRKGGVYPIVWIHVGDAGVSEVYVKRVAFGDGEGVYSLNSKRRWEGEQFDGLLHSDAQ